MKKFDCDLFCKRVNELFADAKQNEIAEKIGISPSVLSKLCSGNSKAPSADTVVKIATYFNVSTDWLLGLSSIPRNCSECIITEVYNTKMSKIDELVLQIAKEVENEKSN